MQEEVRRGAWRDPLITDRGDYLARGARLDFEMTVFVSTPYAMLAKDEVEDRMHLLSFQAAGSQNKAQFKGSVLISASWICSDKQHRLLYYGYSMDLCGNRRAIFFMAFQFR